MVVSTIEKCCPTTPGLKFHIYHGSRTKSHGGFWSPFVPKSEGFFPQHQVAIIMNQRLESSWTAKSCLFLLLVATWFFWQLYHLTLIGIEAKSQEPKGRSIILHAVMFITIRQSLWSKECHNVFSMKWISLNRLVKLTNHEYCRWNENFIIFIHNARQVE